MIELKLDGHTVFQLDVVSQYKDMLRQQEALRNEHLTEIANLRDERDALKTHNIMLRVCLKNLLQDTQHAEHEDCEDGPCPVREARAALKGKS